MARRKDGPTDWRERRDRWRERHPLLWLRWAWCLAPLTAWAVGEELATVPVALSVATFVFSTLVGATTLANRMLAELKANEGQITRPWLFVSAHMLGSWSAGALGFVTAMGVEAGVWKLLGTVMLFSFLGAKAFDRAAAGIRFTVRGP